MKVLKTFNYSLDGVTSKRAEKGTDVTDVPKQYVSNLVKDGYLEESKMATPVEENKMMDENTEIESLRFEYEIKTGQEPDKRWSIKTLRDKLFGDK